MPVQDVDVLALKIEEVVKEASRFYQALDNKFLPNNTVQQYLNLVGDQK